MADRVEISLARVLGRMHFARVGEAANLPDWIMERVLMERERSDSEMAELMLAWAMGYRDAHRACGCCVSQSASAE